MLGMIQDPNEDEEEEVEDGEEEAEDSVPSFAPNTQVVEGEEQESVESVQV